MIHVLRLLVFVWALVLGPLPALAQSAALLSATSQTQEEASGSVAQTDLAEAIRKATEAGVGVIVIDANGQVVTGGDAPPKDPESDAENDPMGDGSTLMKAQSRMSQFRDRLDERLMSLDHSVIELVYVLRATSPTGEIWTFVEVLLYQIALIFAALLLTHQFYNKRFAKRLVTPRIMDSPQGYTEKMPFLTFRFFMGVSSTVITIIVSLILGLVIFGGSDDIAIQFTVTAILTAFFVIRVLSDLWRMILSPYLTQYRLPKLTDSEAHRLYWWARSLAAYDVAALMFSTWIADFGLNYNVYALLYGCLSLVGALGAILLILVNARAISRAFRDRRPREELGWLQRITSVLWAPFLLLGIVVSWLELAFDLVMENATSLPLIAASYGILMSIIVVYGLINYAIERYFGRARAVRKMAEEHKAQEVADGDDSPVPQPRHSVTTYEGLAKRVAGILALVAGVNAAIVIWRPELSLAPGSLMNRLLDVVAILFIGYIVYHVFRIWIDTKIAEESVDSAEGELGDEGGAASASRLATLLPLFRGAILAVVVVTVGLIALLELGINVSPLFAGAGVVGLAIGFGAQTLVRDIFSGAFFLIDDAFRKGEYIDIGDVKGTVEKISVRSFQLRHHLGALNTIPFGEIRVLTNYSRDWVIMKLPLRVTYDTDVEKVRKLIKKLGQELLVDPVIGENFIQPLKSQGVIEMQDSAMIIRVKFMTKPGDQWLVRKKVYEEIRQLFEREGIKFAHREVTVRLADGDPNDLTPKQRDALTGAVQAAIDEDMIDDMGGNDP